MIPLTAVPLGRFTGAVECGVPGDLLTCSTELAALGGYVALLLLF